RQTAEGRLFAEALAVGEGRHSRDDRFGIDIFRHGGAGGGHGAVAEGDVVADGGLAAQDDAGAELGRPGQADLADDDAVGSDDDVVTDLHEVVDFCAATDAGGGELG